MLLRHDGQIIRLKCNGFHFIVIHHINKLIIRNLTGIILQHIGKQAETHQSNQKTYQKSQNGLMIFLIAVGILISSWIPLIRAASALIVIQIIIHFIPPYYLFYYKDKTQINQPGYCENPLNFFEKKSKKFTSEK